MTKEYVKLDENRKYSTINLSQDGLSATGTGTVYQGVSANKGVTAGKWYWEVKINSGTRIDAMMIGVAFTDAPLGGGTSSTYANRHRVYMGNGRKQTGGTNYAVSYNVGDIISVVLDMDNGTIEFLKNGASQGVAFSDLLDFGEVFPHIVIFSAGSVTVNFGQSQFSYQVPDGYTPYSKLVTVERILLKSESKIYSTNIDNDIISLLEIPNESSYNFIKYGNSYLNNLNLSYTNKEYVLQDRESEDVDGLWKIELTRKPLSLKFK